MMILDDSFANRKAETRAMRFAMSGEGLEQVVRYFRRDAQTAILDFGDYFSPGGMNSQRNFSAIGHRVGCVMD